MAKARAKASQKEFFEYPLREVDLRNSTLGPLKIVRHERSSMVDDKTHQTEQQLRAFEGLLAKGDIDFFVSDEIFAPNSKKRLPRSLAGMGLLWRYDEARIYCLAVHKDGTVKPITIGYYGTVSECRDWKAEQFKRILEADLAKA